MTTTDIRTPAEAVAEFLPVLAHRPAGFFSDFDGTLSPLAATPEQAAILPLARAALVRLTTLVDVVGVITGRAAETVEAMVGIDGIDYVGNHGLEWRRDGERGENPEGAAASRDVAAAIAEIKAQVAGTPADDGLRFEDKRLSGSIHYRAAIRPEQVRDPLVDIATRVARAHGLRITEGRKIVEIRPGIIVNKGTALQRLAEERGLHSVLFCGDDVTDLDGFRTLRELRKTGLHTLTIGVASAEAPADIRDLSDVLLASVDDLAEALDRLADALLQAREGAR